MTEEEKARYIREVWEAYLERHPGSQRLMSPMEWAIARHWRETGVPLRVALRAIRETENPGRSMLYFEQPVEQAMRRHESPM